MTELPIPDWATDSLREADRLATLMLAENIAGHKRWGNAQASWELTVDIDWEETFFEGNRVLTRGFLPGYSTVELTAERHRETYTFRRLADTTWRTGAIEVAT